MGVLKCIDWLPEFLRFVISGCIGTCLDFLAYRFLYESQIFPVHRATLSWTVAYGASVLWQHALHALLVFGGFGAAGYCRSLGTTYMAYSGSIVFSPVINWCLVEFGRMPHTIAWFGTLGLTGLVNYVVLTRSMAVAPSAFVILSGGVPISEAMRSGGTAARRDSATHRHRATAGAGAEPAPRSPLDPQRSAAGVAGDGAAAGAAGGVAVNSRAAGDRGDGATPPLRLASTVVTIGATGRSSGEHGAMLGAAGATSRAAAREHGAAPAPRHGSTVVTIGATPRGASVCSVA